MIYKRKNGAFTLIELLVVIAIIGFLAAVVVASINNSRGKARDAIRKSDLNEIAKAVELYYDAIDPSKSKTTNTYALKDTHNVVVGTSGQGFVTYRYNSGAIPSIIEGLVDWGFLPSEATEGIHDPKVPVGVNAVGTQNGYMFFKCGTTGFYVFAELEKPSATDESNVAAVDDAGCAGNGTSGALHYGMNYAVGHP